MEELVTKKPITKAIRKLAVGESCLFPLEQRPSVLIICSRYAKANLRIGWAYEIIDRLSSFAVEVKRIR